MDSDVELDEQQQTNDWQNNGMDEEQNENLDSDSDGSEEVMDKKPAKVKTRKKGTCIKCNKYKEIHGHSMCNACCKKESKAKRKNEGRKPSNLVTCLKCNQLKKHEARGLCKACYNSVKRSKQLDQYSKTRVVSKNGQQDVCLKCDETKTIFNRQMCQTCYEKDLKERHEAGEEHCGNCKRLRPLEENGFCNQCNLNDLLEQEEDGNIELVASNPLAELNRKKFKKQPVTIDPELEALLKGIEKCSSIESANLVTCTGSDIGLKKFGKITIEVSGPTAFEKPLDLSYFGPTAFEKPLNSFYSGLTKKKVGLAENLNAEDDDESPEPCSNKSPQVNTPSKPMEAAELNPTDLIQCADCKEMKPHKAYGCCRACYKRFFRQRKKDEAMAKEDAESVD